MSAAGPSGGKGAWVKCWGHPISNRTSMQQPTLVWDEHPLWLHNTGTFKGSHFSCKEPERSPHPHGLVWEPGFAWPVLAPGPQELLGLLFHQNRGGPWKSRDRTSGHMSSQCQANDWQVQFQSKHKSSFHGGPVPKDEAFQGAERNSKLFLIWLPQSRSCTMWTHLPVAMALYR